MSEEKTLLSLTRLAFLNAIIVSLLGIQFLIPPSFMVMLLLVPLVFILQTYISSFRHVFLSSVFVLILTLSLFGVGIFSWTVFYSLVGMIGGFTMKMSRLTKLWRVIIIATAYIASFALFVIGLGVLIGLEWQVIMEYDILIPWTSISPRTILGVGIFVWGISLSLCVNWLVHRVLKQVEI